MVECVRGINRHPMTSDSKNGGDEELTSAAVSFTEPVRQQKQLIMDFEDDERNLDNISELLIACATCHNLTVLVL